MTEKVRITVPSSVRQTHFDKLSVTRYSLLQQSYFDKLSVTDREYLDRRASTSFVTGYSIVITHFIRERSSQPCQPTGKIAWGSH